MNIFKKHLGEGVVLALSAGTVVAVLSFLHAPIAWKLAQRTMFLADFDGLRELLSTHVAPGGLLDWVSRGCQVTGLGACAWLLYGLAAAGTISLWWCVFARERKGLGIVLAFPAVLLPLFPPLLAGEELWLLDDPAAGFRNTFGLWVALGVYAGARRLPRGGTALVAIVLFPWFGIYPILGAMAASVWCWPLVAVPALFSVFYYDDMSFETVYLGSGAVLDQLRLCSLNCWNVGAFLCFFIATMINRHETDVFVRALAEKMPARLRFSLAPPRRVAVMVGVALVLVGGLWASRPNPDFRGQLERERAVVEGRWEDVLAAKPRNGRALRMESAYRILALARLGRLPEHLFDEPIWSSHESVDRRDEEAMDAYELLFAYGLLLPARRSLFTVMTTEDWKPRHFLVLGDIAFLSKENALAERNYTQLLRCPFYRAIARSRLALLQAPNPHLHLPPDLARIAALAQVVNAMLAHNGVVFIDGKQNAEQLIYNYFMNVTNGDAETVKFGLACLLLKKKHDRLAFCRNLLEGFYGRPSAVPISLQQALLVSEKCSTEMVLSAVQQQAMAYRDDAKRFSSKQMDESLFISRWASTYFFYNEFVK